MKKTSVKFLVYINILLLFHTSKLYADVIKLPDGHTYPNGVTHDNMGNMYVGFVTDGVIYKKAVDSDRWQVFYSGSDNIFAATALRYDKKNNLVWGASPDFIGTKNDDNERYFRQNRIFALNAKTGHVEKIVMIPKGSFGNDIAVDDDGNLYITDSFNAQIFILKEEADNLEIYIKNPLLGSEERIGLAGIAKTPGGDLFVSNYSDFTVFRISEGNVDEIKLPRKIPNADGIYALSDSAFIVVAGAVKSGNGEVLRIDVEDTEEGPVGRIQVIDSGLTSPVNLSISNDVLYVTESKIRHIFIDNKAKAPKEYYIHKYKKF